MYSPPRVSISSQLTCDREASGPFSGAGGVDVEGAGVAALVTVTDTLDADLAGVPGGGDQLHVLLPAHSVLAAGLVGDQRLVLGVQPAHLGHGVARALLHQRAAQREGLAHHRLHPRWRRNPA